VTAWLGETGTVVVQCDALPLATRYRWRTRLAGSSAAYVLAASTVAPAAFLTEVAPGSSIEIVVQAVNVNQQGVASEPIVFTMPVAKAAEVKLAEAAHHTNGNGAPALASAESLNGNHRR
jgi:hypothetical protein